MDQFNKDTYKQQTLIQQFFNSCMGKIVILFGVIIILYIVALFTVPSADEMLIETRDNIHECLQDNDSIKIDEIDETISNVSRTLLSADTLATNKEAYKAFRKYNRIEVYSHPGFRTVHVINSFYPQGRRISIGIFGIVISTIHYKDLVLDLGAVRGDYGKQLNAPVIEDVDSDYVGGELNVEPYHYEGDLEN